MSPRTFSRQFRAQTGTTPLNWMNRQRVRLAQRLLEQTDHSCERIGELVGFGSPTAFRERFREIAGVSPRVYRGTFRAPMTHAGSGYCDDSVDEHEWND